MDAQVRTFRAPDARAALDAVKAALGGEAVILSTREIAPGLFGKAQIEVTAALAAPPVSSRAAEAYAPRPLEGYSAPKFDGYSARHPEEHHRPHPESAAPERLDAPAARSSLGYQGRADERERRSAESPSRRREETSSRGAEPLSMRPSGQPRRDEPAFVGSLQGDSGLASEMRTLRRLLEDTRGELNESRQAPQLAEKIAPLQALLAERGFSPEAAAELLGSVRGARDASQTALTALRERLAERLTVTRAPWVPGRKKVIALIGSPGVGKTTTIAKIAAHALMLKSRPRVALITVDHYRIGAREHLARYGEILDVPVLGARSVGELREAVDSQSEADLILVDTAGRSDTQAIASQAGLLRAVPQIELHLVLSAAEGHQQLTANATRYGSLRPEKLIFTKLDEAEGPGAILSATELLRRPIACFADGQRVPEDLHAADAMALADRLLSGRAGPR